MGDVIFFEQRKNIDCNKCEDKTINVYNDNSMKLIRCPYCRSGDEKVSPQRNKLSMRQDLCTLNNEMCYELYYRDKFLAIFAENSFKGYSTEEILTVFMALNDGMNLVDYSV